MDMLTNGGSLGVVDVYNYGIHSNLPSATKVTTTGTSLLTLENSAGKYLKLSLAGESEQDRTTGAQLWNGSVTYGATIDGAGNIAENINYMYTDFIPLSAGQAYCVSENQTADLTSVGTTTRCAIYDANKNFVKLGYEQNRTETKRYSHSFSMPENGAYIRIGFRATDEEIMINAGANAKPFEHYTGGKPSPSPEYPQEIRSAGVRKKNLFNVTGLSVVGTQYGVAGKTFEQNNVVNHLRLRCTKESMLQLKPSTTYLLQVPDAYKISIHHYADNQLCLGDSGWRTGAYTFTTPQDYWRTSYVLARVVEGAPILQSDAEKLKIQLEEGSTATAYEPYGYKADVRIHNNGYLMRGTYFAQIQSIPLVKGRTYTITSSVVGNVINAFIFDKSPGTSVRNSAELYGYGYVTLKLQTPNSSGFVDSPCRMPANYNVKYTFAVTVDGLYLYQAINQPQLNTDVFYIYEGDSVGSNVPCQEQTATIHTKEPLRGIEDGRDVICKRDSVWGIWRNAHEIDMPKSGWVFNTETSGFYEIKAKALTDSIIPKVYIYNQKYISNYFEKGTNCRVSSWDKYIYVRFPKSEQGCPTSVDEANAWMAAHEVKLVYALATPVWEPLDDATQAALNTLTAYKGTTVIDIDSGDVGVQINATYKKKGKR